MQGETRLQFADGDSDTVDLELDLSLHPSAPQGRLIPHNGLEGKNCCLQEEGKVV